LRARPATQSEQSHAKRDGLHGHTACRILLVALFLFSGVMKLIDVSGTVAHIQSKGLPAPALLAVAAGLLEVVAGLRWWWVGERVWPFSC
jgi:hypothetical protein